MTNTRRQPADLGEVDWRFLLGRGRWDRTVVHGPQALKDAIAAISDAAVEEIQTDLGVCDLAVAVEPADELIRRMAATLRAEGHLVLLFGSSSSAAHLDTTLRAAGVRQVASYTGWPAKAPRRWVGLGDPVAHRFLERETSVSRPMRQPRRWLRWMSWRARRRLGRLPVLIVCVKDEGRIDNGVRPQPLLDHATPLGALVTESLRGIQDPAILLRGAGERSWSKVVILFIDRSDSRVRLALKVARSPGEESGLRHEANTLRALQTLGLGQRDGIPLVVSEGTIDDGNVALVETALDGEHRWIGPSTSATLVAQTIERATDWLAELAEKTIRPPVAEPDRRRAVRQLLDEFAASFAGVVDFSETDREAMSETLARPAMVVEHRDFALWNLLWGGDGSLAAADWESAAVDGWPLLDVLYFLAYATFYIAGAETTEQRLDAYQRSRDPSKPIGRAASDAIERYARRLGMNQELVRASRRFVWAIHALSEYARAVDDHGPNPPADVLRSGLMVNLWLQESRSEPGAALSRAGGSGP